MSVFPAAEAFARAAWRRWTQKLHFSTTPRWRIETSGLREAFIPSGHSGLHQLKERVWYGQATMQ